MTVNAVPRCGPSPRPGQQKPRIKTAWWPKLLGLSLVLCVGAAQAIELYFGKNGWIFDYLYDYQRFASSPRLYRDSTDLAFKMMGLIKTQLGARGVRLVVALVPARERLYRDQLPAGYVLPKRAEAFYDQAQKRFRALGIESVDLKTPLEQYRKTSKDKELLYFRHDSHWSPRGSLEAARVVAKALEGRHAKTLAAIPKQGFSLEVTEPQAIVGDYLGFLSETQRAKLRPDLARRVVVRQESTDLLGETQSQIVVVGTSFSNEAYFAFVPGLAYFLQRRVGNAQGSGQGFWTPMLAYLQSQSFVDNPPKILVWEIAEVILTGKYKTIEDTPGALKNFTLGAAAALGGECQESKKNLVGFYEHENTVRLEFDQPVAPSDYLHLQLGASQADALGVLVNARNVQKRLNLTLAQEEKRTLNFSLESLAGGSVVVLAGNGAAPKVLQAKLCATNAAWLRLSNTPAK